MAAKRRAAVKNVKESGGFKVGDRVMVFSDDPSVIENYFTLYKSGKVIGINCKGKLCIEFADRILGGHCGNSDRFVGQPYHCFYVVPEHVRPVTVDIIDKVYRIMQKKELDSQELWYSEEERY